MVYLIKIKKSKADIVFYVGATPEGAMILKQAREIGLTKEASFIGAEEMSEMELLSLAGAEAAEGTYAVGLWGAAPPELEKKVKEKFNAPMHYGIIFGYDALYVMVDAIERAGSLDSVKIKDALKASKFKGLQGEITFDTFDNFKNQGRYTPVIVKWEGGARKVAE
jgi:branched-chain amino acid transport system substrate-binding protein